MYRQTDGNANIHAYCFISGAGRSPNAVREDASLRVVGAGEQGFQLYYTRCERFQS